MKRLLKQVLLISFAAVLMLFTAQPLRSEAFGEQYKDKYVIAGTLKAGDWMTVDGKSESKNGNAIITTHNLYKIEVPANCYIKTC